MHKSVDAAATFEYQIDPRLTNEQARPHHPRPGHGQSPLNGSIFAASVFRLEIASLVVREVVVAGHVLHDHLQRRIRDIHAQLNHEDEERAHDDDVSRRCLGHGRRRQRIALVQGQVFVSILAIAVRVVGAAISIQRPLANAAAAEAPALELNVGLVCGPHYCFAFSP